MSFDKIFDLTAGMYFNFHNIPTGSNLQTANTVKWDGGDAGDCSSNFTGLGPFYPGLFTSHDPPTHERFPTLVGRGRSGQDVLSKSHGPDRIASGRVRRFFKYHGFGRITLALPDPTRPTRGDPTPRTALILSTTNDIYIFNHSRGCSLVECLAGRQYPH